MYSETMNRRTFLKAIGLAIAAPGAVLGAVKATPTIPAASGGGLTVAMIQEVVRKRLRDSPAAFYYIFIHPQQFYALKVATARDEYKHKRWLPRHNRWLKRQSRPPIHYEKAECGVWDSSVRIVETKRLEEK